MASIRQKGNKWYACWRVGGKSVEKATGISVKDNLRTPAQNKNLAMQTAESMERTAKGDTSYYSAIEAVRGAAAVSGGTSTIPTARAYLEGYLESKGGSKSSMGERKRAYTRLIDFLGADADKRLDCITPKMCKDFIRSLLPLLSVGSVKLARDYISAAFNAACEDELISKNPMKRVNISEEAASVIPERGLDKQKRFPFTTEDMKKLLYEFPRVWRDMVLVCYMTGGQRLGDICRLKWEQVNFEEGSVTFRPKKGERRGQVIIQAMAQELRNRLEEIQQEQGKGKEEYVFPEMARRKNRGDSSVSTEFTSLLKAFGIISNDSAQPKLTGNRRRISEKSFHSIRHTAVTNLRNNPAISRDLSRAVVGHENEEVEQQYYTATMKKKLEAMNALAAAIPAAQ